MSELTEVMILSARLQYLEEQISAKKEQLELRENLIELLESNKLDSSSSTKIWLDLNSDLLDLQLKHNQLEREFLLILKKY